MIEHWTIYDPATGAIRQSGNGPTGDGALQALRPGEALGLFASNPNTQRVVTGADGEPALADR